MSKKTVTDLVRLVEEVERDSIKEHVSTFLIENESALSEAPASSRKSFHHAYEGGLVKHIFEVYELSCGLMEAMMENQAGNGGCLSNTFCHIVPDGNWRSALLNVSIFHDIHKMSDPMGSPQYVSNILKSGAVSEAIPYKINPAYMDFNDTHAVSSLVNADEEDCYALAWALENGEMTVKNGGIKSLMVLAAKAPGVLQGLLDTEVNAIKYHGGAYETSKYELQGKEDLLQIIFHAADMASSRSASE